jgi:hypothetical protein
MYINTQQHFFTNYRKMGTLFSIRCLYYSKDVALFPAGPWYCRTSAVRSGRQYCHALLLSISVQFVFNVLKRNTPAPHKLEFEGRVFCHENTVQSRVSSKLSLKNKLSITVYCTVLQRCNSVQ